MYVRLEKHDGSISDRPATLVHDGRLIEWPVDLDSRGYVIVKAWQVFSDAGQPMTERNEDHWPWCSTAIAVHDEDEERWFFRLPVNGFARG